jgi:hypothetical protein
MRDEYDYDDDERPAVPRQVVVGLAAIAGTAALIFVWLKLSRPSEEIVSGDGFNMPGAPAGAMPFDRKGQTGLSYARLGADYRGASASPAAPSAAASLGVAAPAVLAASSGEMAAAGLPVDPDGLRKLGQKDGLLTAAFKRLLDHPRVISALFNNKLVVDAVMNREAGKKYCANSSDLAAILSNPNDSDMKELQPLVHQALSRADTAAAFAGSAMASRLMECPSVQGLVNDRAAVMSIVQSNPDALGIASDPRVAQAVSDNQQAGGLMSGLQSSLGGAAGGTPVP